MVKGTKQRVNLQPNAPRDKHGKHIHAIPSDVIQWDTPDGQEIYHLCKLLNPDLPFEFVTVNKFKDASQCEHHKDTGNKGVSRIILFGPFVGGALVLDDGREFKEKRVWHEYDGVNIGHRVAPFQGERLSVVVYSPKVNRRAIACPAVEIPTSVAGRGNATASRGAMSMDRGGPTAKMMPRRAFSRGPGTRSSTTALPSGGDMRQSRVQHTPGVLEHTKQKMRKNPDMMNVDGRGSAIASGHIEMSFWQ
jgi:hypothetical protein